ncbi:SDR family NAD(P)-dependent oxidoreductase [Helicobacter sp. 11S02629-2]|uniref:SDR family NAD(P)-dependent oxidoreductase n=1 Tax=Helicobacter sp. 11S02629-2 TaxID=1476195 RepID=UPI000BA5E12E|nr:SDR family NAD(P)-dependent oxidoreductase [Helicobacter sp. 11S02629-2]PAF45613.1 hypothetical protein BKH40_01660 [Helicobacter sp. 11S02629-2]
MFALITGASSGIGKSIATRLASLGIPLMLVARDKNALDELAVSLTQIYSLKVHTLGLDLNEDFAIEKILGFIREHGIKLSYLINNAGVGLYGKLIDQDQKDLSNMLDLNVKTLTLLTSALLPMLVASTDKVLESKILFLSSMAALSPFPSLAAYAASKTYVKSLAIALRYEQNIKVTILLPGATKTNFEKRAKVKGSSMFKNAMLPDEVAREAIDSMKKGRLISVPGAMNKFLYFISLGNIPMWLRVRFTTMMAR